jgi:hypothetical protein
MTNQVTEQELAEWKSRHGDGLPSEADKRILRLIAALQETGAKYHEMERMCLSYIGHLHKAEAKFAAIRAVVQNDFGRLSAMDYVQRLHEVIGE